MSIDSPTSWQPKVAIALPTTAGPQLTIEDRERLDRLINRAAGYLRGYPTDTVERTIDRLRELAVKAAREPVTNGLQLTVGDYRGPGTYQAPQASMQVFRPDATLGWRSRDGDQVSLVLDTSRLSGTVEATLTNLTNDTSKVQVSGRWSCR